MFKVTCDSSLNHFPDIETLWSLMGQHVEKVWRVGGLERLPEVFVAVVQLCSNVVKCDAFISKTL